MRNLYLIFKVPREGSMKVIDYWTNMKDAADDLERMEHTNPGNCYICLEATVVGPTDLLTNLED